MKAYQLTIPVENKPGVLAQITSILARKNINIENGYGFVIESRKNAVFVIDVNDIERAKDLIEASGFKTLTPQELSEIEPFHYVGY